MCSRKDFKTRTDGSSWGALLPAQKPHHGKGKVSFSVDGGSGSELGHHIPTLVSRQGALRNLGIELHGPPKLSMPIGWGHRNRVPALEAGNPRSRCCQVGFCCGFFPWCADGRVLPVIFTQSLLCVLISSYKNTSHIILGSILT